MRQRGEESQVQVALKTETGADILALVTAHLRQLLYSRKLALCFLLVPHCAVAMREQLAMRRKGIRHWIAVHAKGVPTMKVKESWDCSQLTVFPAKMVMLVAVAAVPAVRLGMTTRYPYP